MANDPTSPRNRRTSERRRPRGTLTVECRRGTMGLGPNIALRFLDMSETGVRLIVKTVLRSKEETEVLLSGSGIQKQIKRIATVAWVVECDEGQCVGLHFQKPLEYRSIQMISASKLS